MTNKDHNSAPSAIASYPSHYTDTVQDDNLEALMDIWDEYKGRIILFLGAGASVGAQNKAGESLPTAIHLRDDLWRKFMNKNEDFDLGMMSLEHATALIESKVASNGLRQYIAKKFEVSRCLWQHFVLPFLSPKILFTTNYDNLIEEAWRAHLTIPSLNVLFEPKQHFLPNRIPFYKPHGSIECFSEKIGKGGLVLTQFDYFNYISQKQELLNGFLNACQDCCVIFIGYSFFDSDLGAAIYNFRQKNRDMHWYAVFPRSESTMKDMYFTQLGVKTIAKTFYRFIAELDERINFIPDEYKISRIINMQAAGLIQ